MTNLEFKTELEKRTKTFAVATFRLLDELPKKNSTRVIAYQLGKSASSVGANYREANRAESRDDFAHKIQIALKEASESVYWFEILSELSPANSNTHKSNSQSLSPSNSNTPTLSTQTLLKESIEIRNILQSISKSLHRPSTQTLKHS